MHVYSLWVLVFLASVSFFYVYDKVLLSSLLWIWCLFLKMNGKSACKRPPGLQNLKLPKKAHQERAEQQRKKKENDKKENNNSTLLLQNEMKSIKYATRFNNQLPIIMEHSDGMEEHDVFHFFNWFISFVFYFFCVLFLFVFACFFVVLF